MDEYFASLYDHTLCLDVDIVEDIDIDALNEMFFEQDVVWTVEEGDESWFKYDIYEDVA